jgi:hypothetical protein
MADALHIVEETDGTYKMYGTLADRVREIIDAERADARAAVIAEIRAEAKDRRAKHLGYRTDEEVADWLEGKSDE